MRACACFQYLKATSDNDAPAKFNDFNCRSLDLESVNPGRESIGGAKISRNAASVNAPTYPKSKEDSVGHIHVFNAHTLVQGTPCKDNSLS